MLAELLRGLLVRNAFYLLFILQFKCLWASGLCVRARDMSSQQRERVTYVWTLALRMLLSCSTIFQFSSFVLLWSGFKLVVASMSVCAAIARLNHFARAGLDRYGKFFGQRCRPNASGDASVIVTCVERCCWAQGSADVRERVTICVTIGCQGEFSWCRELCSAGVKQRFKNEPHFWGLLSGS